MTGWRTYFVLLVKLLLFAVVLWWLTRQVSFVKLLSTLQNINSYALVGVLLYQFVLYVAFALRVRYTAMLSGLRLPAPDSIRWEYEILFLELLLPVPDAEDFFRILLWKRTTTNTAAMFSALLFSRLCGLLSLSLLIPFTVMLLWNGLQVDSTLALIVFCSVPVLVLSIVLFLPQILRVIGGLLKKYNYLPVAVANLFFQISDLKQNTVQYAKGTLAALLYMTLLAGSYYAVTISLNVAVSYLHILLFTPFLIIAFMLPLSPQGLGLPQAAMVWMLTQNGAPAETAAAVGIVHFAGYVLVILTGGVLVLLNNNKWTELVAAWKSIKSG